MAVERATFGYRDPYKSMTIKALQDRQKAMQESLMGAGTAPVSHPLQGAANMLEAFGAVRASRRTDQAEADARAHLSEIMAKVGPEGVSTEQWAEINTLDPELAQQLRREVIDRMTQERANQFATSERLGTQEYQTGIHEDTQAEARTTAETLAKTNAAAAEELAREQEKAARQQAIDAENKAKLDAGLQMTSIAGVNQADRLGLIAPGDADTAATDIATKRGYDTSNAKPETFQPLTPEQAAQWNMTPEEAARYKFNLKTNAPELIKPEMSATSRANSYSPAQTKVEQALGDQVADWITAGSANTGRAIKQVKMAMDLLKTNPDASGFKRGLQDAYLPESLSKFFNPEGTIARDAIRETVQQTLRQVLGSQFTQLEGEALMNRAFDIKLGTPENLRRAQLLMDQIVSIAQSKQEMTDHYNKEGDFLNYHGKGMDGAALKALLDSDYGTSDHRYDPAVDEPGVLDKITGGGGGGGAPAPAPTEPSKFKIRPKGG